MRIVIMGCGRVGSTLATQLDKEGHEVTIIDLDSGQFRRLSSDFHGTSVVGNGIDEDTLRKAQIEQADAFAAVTQGDNRNVMAAQMAKHLFRVPKVLCRIYDPIREEIYRNLGIETISPTIVISGLFKEALEGKR